MTSKGLLKGIPKFQIKLGSKKSNVFRFFRDFQTFQSDQSSTDLPKVRGPLGRSRRVTGKGHYTSNCVLLLNVLI